MAKGQQRFLNALCVATNQGVGGQSVGKRIFEVVFILGLPTVAFLGGVWLMTQLSGREQETEFLGTLDSSDAKPLAGRFSYDVDAVARQWSKLCDAGLLGIERYFLELDLIFPFLYGGALAVSLLLAWAALGRPFSSVWIMAPVAVTMIADWTENLVQLAQMNRFQADHIAGLQTGWIGVASIATSLKVVFFSGTSLALLSLALVMIFVRRRA
jgi:hypothetical protein